MTTPLHAGRSIECFAPGTPRTTSVTVEDCEFVFEAILRDPAGAMTTHKFSHQPKQNEFGVPALWAVGGCEIVLTSGNNTATDSFRLVDVIVKAMEVIDICPGKSKTHLGGIALIGHKQSFFVAVNGPEDLDDPELVGFGGGANGTGLVLAQ